MFNHSAIRQNVIWSRDLITETIIYKARQDIKPGEELCISYGNARLWFKDADLSEDDEKSLDQDEFSRSGLGALALIDSNQSSG